jgi:hypothetical protein
VSFEDANRLIDPFVFNGLYTKTGAGVGLGMGYQCQRANLGSAWFPLSCGVSGGLDFSVGFVYGLAYVSSVWCEECGCELKLDKNPNLGTR